MISTLMGHFFAPPGAGGGGVAGGNVGAGLVDFGNFAAPGSPGFCGGWAVSGAGLGGIAGAGAGAGATPAAAVVQRPETMVGVTLLRLRNSIALAEASA